MPFFGSKSPAQSPPESPTKQVEAWSPDLEQRVKKLVDEALQKVDARLQKLEKEGQQELAALQQKITDFTKVELAALEDKLGARLDDHRETHSTQVQEVRELLNVGQAAKKSSKQPRGPSKEVQEEARPSELDEKKEKKEKKGKKKQKPSLEVDNPDNTEDDGTARSGADENALDDDVDLEALLARCKDEHNELTNGDEVPRKKKKKKKVLVDEPEDSEAKKEEDRLREEAAAKKMPPRVWSSAEEAANNIDPKTLYKFKQVLKTYVCHTFDQNFVKKIDRDRSGNVSLNEWLTTLRQEFRIPPASMSTDLMKQVFAMADTERTGFVNVQALAHFLKSDHGTAVGGASNTASTSSTSHPEVEIPIDVLLKVINTLKKAVCNKLPNGENIDTWFDRVDRDGNNCIDLSEWNIFVRDLSIGPDEMSDAQIRSLFRKIDTDNSGFVDKEELIDIVRAMPSSSDQAHKQWNKIKATDALPPQVILKLISRLKGMIYLSNSTHVNEDLITRLTGKYGDAVDWREWNIFLRHDLNMTKFEISEEQIRLVFEMLANDSGAVPAEDIMALANSINEHKRPKLAWMLSEAIRVQSALSMAGLRSNQSTPGGVSRRDNHVVFKNPYKDFALEIKPGTRVRVQSLIARADLNGIEGTVVDFDRDDFRYKVCMDDGARMQFGPKNLKVVTRSSAPSSRETSPRSARLSLQSSPAVSNMGNPLHPLSQSDSEELVRPRRGSATSRKRVSIDLKASEPSRALSKGHDLDFDTSQSPRRKSASASAYPVKQYPHISQNGTFTESESVPSASASAYPTKQYAHTNQNRKSVANLQSDSLSNVLAQPYQVLASPRKSMWKEGHDLDSDSARSPAASPYPAKQYNPNNRKTLMQPN